MEAGTSLQNMNNNSYIEKRKNKFEHETTTDMQVENEFPYKYYITPISKELADQFLRNPLTFGIALKNSVFSEAIMKTLESNKIRGTVVISTKNKIEDIKNIKIGSWKVHCKLLDSLTKSYGVIGPIGIDENIEALKNDLIDSGYSITNVARLNKKEAGKIVPSQCIKIGFTTPDIPTKLNVSNIVFPIRLFIPSAKQCYRCQKFGHWSNSCRASIRCLFCSLSHDIKSCPKTEKKCANCKGNHTANYGGCPEYKTAKNVEKISAETGQSYSEILKQIKITTVPISERPATHTINNINKPISLTINRPALNRTCSLTNIPSYASVTKQSPSSGTHSELEPAVNNVLYNYNNTSPDNVITDKLCKIADTLMKVVESLGTLVKSLQSIITSTICHPLTAKPTSIMISDAVDKHIQPNNNEKIKTNNDIHKEDKQNCTTNPQIPIHEHNKNIESDETKKSIKRKANQSPVSQRNNNCSKKSHKT